MARIVVEVPGCDAENVDLTPGHAVLIGRDPDVERLEEPMLADESLSAAKFESRSVSANHALIRLTKEGIFRLRDVRSRNGSWLRLPSSGEVQVTTTEPIQLHLASLTVATHEDGGPPDAVWGETQPFANAVARSVGEWLRGRQIMARVSVVNSSQDSPPRPGRMALGKGCDLIVDADETLGTEWSSLIGAVYRYVERQRALLSAEEEANSGGLLTVASPAMRRAFRDAVDVAQRSARCVLINGPTGSGKEGLARTIYRYSGRSGPMIARNCAMLDRELARSELFGAEPGSFTGCTKRIIGAVERAQSGTLFLDEIGELSPDVQAMLLRFLDSGEFERLGEYGRPRYADVTLVCATNRDLRDAVHTGKFRSDLWYRLSAHSISVPPLRKRREDLIAFLKAQRLAGELSAWSVLSTPAAELVLAHAWEGNFRELRNFVARLPFGSGPSGVDAATCRNCLAEVALERPSQPPSAHPTIAAKEQGVEREEWAAIFLQAVDAFSEDTGPGGLKTWDHFKECMEKYLKPLALVHLGGLTGPDNRAAVDIQEIARRLDADRGTVMKQVKRYFERYAPGSQPSERPPR